MGYTHYWTIKGGLMYGTKEQMLANVRKVVKAHRSIIQYDYDNSKAPHVTEESICFNGIEEDGHETFLVRRFFGYDFCKTDRKPYDLPVCKVLLILKAHYGNHMDLSSDGFDLGPDEKYDGCWEQAIKDVRRMGYTIEYNVYPRKDSPYFDAKIENARPPK